MRLRMHVPTRHSALFLGLLGILALLAGCGSISQAHSAAQSEDATASMTATSTDMVTSGQVTLHLDKQRYATRDTVVVTIANGLAQMIWAADHQTACTQLVAEQSLGGAWEAVGKCRLMTPTRLMALAPGAMTVRLDTSGWSTGVYRVTLAYTSGYEGMSDAGGIVHSAEFFVG